MRKKMSVIAATAIEDDQELTLDRKTWDKLKAVEPEDIQKYLPDYVEEEREEDIDPNIRKHKFLTDGGVDHLDVVSDDDDDFSGDEKAAQVNRMAAEIEDSIRQQRDYQMLKSKKQEKKDIKAKAMIELQRKQKMDESDEEQL
mmetsp:Transcript_42071/g.64499  ORF Transcript_42071/g.64499 Transcript_42071/m.64499 type:complete len:143 (+) Transcript_42071:1169-1597(+)